MWSTCALLYTINTILQKSYYFYLYYFLSAVYLKWRIMFPGEINIKKKVYHKVTDIICKSNKYILSEIP